MDVDEHLLLLTSALKATKDGDESSKKKLIQNVSNCFLRVKKEKKALNIPEAQQAEELQNFQAKAVLLLLLCSSKIREAPNIESCREFQFLISSLPTLPETVIFAIVRNQKIYSFLSPLLSWLPPQVVDAVTREYFSYVDEVTPLTLTISVELLKALLFSCQYRYTDNDSTENEIGSLQLLINFFSTKSVSSETQALVKFSGYFCMYLLECLYLLLIVYVGQRIKEPDTLPCVQAWKNLWKSIGFCSKVPSLFFTNESIKSLLLMCQNNNSAVTVDMWVEWNEQILPSVVAIHQGSSEKRRRTKSIQLVIRNIAFDILRIFEAHPTVKESLVTNEYQDLLQFFQQVAIDPDYDPDQDLTIEQLIHEISQKDERQEKLVGFLVQKEDVFRSDDVCRCLREQHSALDNQMRLQLLQRCIQRVKCGAPCSCESLTVVLELAADLDPEQLGAVITESLAAGLDDSLKSLHFKTQLTAIFNQLADQNSVGPSGRHVWLCLQSGRAVVEHAVRLAITMTGLVPVMVQTLADIPQVCQAVMPSGNSLLVSTLFEWQNSGLSDREEREFIALAKGLLNAKGVLHTTEVLQVMVEPSLVVTDNRHPEKLVIPLELLKKVVTLDVDAVVKPGAPLVSLVLALAHLIDATVYLEGRRAGALLILRSLATSILSVMTGTILSSQQRFEREISLLKQVAGQYKFHPLSFAQLSVILDAEPCGESCVDLLLQAMMKLSLGEQQENHMYSDDTAAVSEMLQEISRPEWIIALLQVLPHCTENEWRSALFLTHKLGSEHTVFPTLEVFREVLHLMCVSPDPEPPSLQQAEQGKPTYHSPVSFHYCFTFFASATMVYIEEVFQLLKPKEKFLNLGKVFCWWCSTVPMYCCNPELPTILLARVCALLEEMIVSGQLEVSTVEDAEPDTCHDISIKAGENNSISMEQLSEDKGIAGEEHSELQQEKFDLYAGQNHVDSAYSLTSNIKTQVYITKTEMRHELEKLTLAVLRFVPSSNLLASVASKLGKLYEL